MKYKLYTIYILIASMSIGFSQTGAVYETYKYRDGSTNSSDGSIFNRPFQEYNYLKTHRGIEVYETYKYRYASGDTNSSRGSVISKPFPTYIIVGDKMYRTYKYNSGSTNTSNGSIFNKPFEAKVIDPNLNSVKTTIQKQISNYKYISTKYSGPTYDGETFSEGSSE
jgi:hypothetical protein